MISCLPVAATRHVVLASLLLIVGAVPVAAQMSVTAPEVVLKGIPFTVTATADETVPDDFAVRIGSELFALSPSHDDPSVFEATIAAPTTGVQSVALVADGTIVSTASTRSIPGWLSIVPPVLAILIALAFKRVIPALFLGIWVGATIAAGIGFTGAGRGLLDVMQIHVLQALADSDHASIILFTLMIGGMVGIVSRNGGMQGIVDKIATWATTPVRGQIATGTMGIAIFFDDYANTLVVGNTMRPITDSLRISREKLAYIVDSTAAPVACLAFVTTWIGYEVGLIGAAADQLDGFTESAYLVFLNSILYSFYPLLAILFVFLVAGTGRDFGPMLRAERRARIHGKLLADDANVDSEAAEAKEVMPKEGKPRRAVNAGIPIVVLIGSVLVGLYATGEGDNLKDIIGSADSYKSLVWASLLGVIAAAVLSLGQRILTLGETIEAWYAGLRAMLFAMIILILAWALSSITDVLHTADYLVSILGETLSPALVPALVFVLAAATAFATGSSWGTMGILVPLVVPLAWNILQTDGTAGDPATMHIIYSTVSCVLAGAVWGDHCSPISDTTILSSMASSCDHIDHVRTQLPYAGLVGGVALLLGTIPAGFGLPWWAGLGVGAVLLVIVIRTIGRRAESTEGELAV